MTSMSDWIYNEFKQVGKDYASAEEVAVYDSSHAKFRDVVTESENILDSLSVSSGESLLDIGCGTGVFAMQAAKRGMKVTAVDISEAMLAFAESKSMQAKIDGIRFLKGGFLNLPKPTGLFDYVTTSFSFHHLPDFWKLIALKNVYATLANSGKLFIQDVVIEEPDCIDHINALIDAQTELGGAFLRTDAIEHFRDEYSTYSWILEQMLVHAGFKINQHESTMGLIGKYICSKNQA